MSKEKKFEENLADLEAIVQKLESGQVPLAVGYTGISVMGGLLATWAGLSLTRL